RDAAAGVKRTERRVTQRDAHLFGLVDNDEENPFAAGWLGLHRFGHGDCTPPLLCLAESQARKPAQQARASHGKNPVEPGIAQREFAEIGVEADLRNDERRRLAAHHIALAQQQHLDEIGPGRNIRGKGDGGAKQPVAEKTDAVRPLRPHPGTALFIEQGGAESRDLVRWPIRIARVEANVLDADLVQSLHARRRDPIERAVAEDGVVAGHPGEFDGMGVDPDAGEVPLLTHHDVALGTAHDNDDVARPVGRAKEHDRGSGEAGGDGDEMAGEIGEQGLLGACRRGQDEQCQDERAAPDHGSTGAIEKGKAGRAVRSKTSLAATARRMIASSARNSSPRSFAPQRDPNCAPMTPPSSRISASTTSTVLLATAWRMVTAAVTKMIWKSEVPGTIAVGMPSR